MPDSRYHVHDGAEVWLGVHDASTMLGVSPATLRRWSAAGKIEAFTTPGGHRRYARSMLQRLLHQSTSRGASVSALGESSERVSRLIRRHLSALCRDIAWVEAADQETQHLLALSGRVMVDGLLGYLDATSAEARDAAIRPAMEAAALHGRVAARHHGDLGETVESFHRFRGLLIADLAELACRHGLDTSQTTQILTRANQGVDRLIVALVASHAVVSDSAAVVG